MKSLALIILLQLVSFAGFALDIKSVQSRNAQNVFQITTVIECKNAADDSCQKLCGQQDLCSRPEPSCVNCAGTANELIRILFTRLDSFYQPTMDRWSNEELVQYLNTKKYVLLSYQSVYNFHKAWGSAETLTLFQGFCQLPTEQPLLLLQLDSIGQPQELKAVICQDQNGSYAQKVQTRATAPENIKMELK